MTNIKQNDSGLENLKKEYLKKQKKYNFVDFKLMNEDFQIERISEIETEYLVRELRKFIAEKFSNYLRFVETILNPTNASMLVFYFIKSMSVEDKKILRDIYKKLAENEITILELDIEFNEKREAEYIKNSFNLWQDMKKDLLDVISSIKKNLGSKFETNNKDYFG